MSDEWNAMTYAGKDTILRVVREEADRMFALAEAPGAWSAPTACESWQVKDVIGHLVDTTEGYFKAFEVARSGAEAPAAYGLAGMHQRAGETAQAFGELSQADMLARARADLDKMMGILEPLTEEEWGGLMVPHFYMGTVPAFIYAAGQLMDYGVHTWDIKEGSGQAPGISGDAADLLVLTTFGRVNGGTVRGDEDLADRFLNLFFRI